MITRKTLIRWSIARDVANWLLIGQVPGVCQLLDIPLLVMHFKYAGAKASFTLLELIPAAGFIPIFTIAAYCYPDNDPPDELPKVAINAKVPPQLNEVPPIAAALEQGPGLYAYVDGKVTQVRLNPEQLKRMTQIVRSKPESQN